MANFKTDIAWSPNSGVQRQSEEVSGIMGIAPDDPQAEAQGFIESMMGRLYDNFYDKDDAVDFFDKPSPVSTTTLPGSDWDTLEPVDELLRDYREGKTSIETIMPPMGQEPDSLAPSTSIRPKEKGSILARGMSPRPQARPVEEEAATPTGAGLMSPTANTLEGPEAASSASVQTLQNQTETVSRGSKGNNVLNAQLRLAELGYDIGRGGKSGLKKNASGKWSSLDNSQLRGVDSDFGPSTEKAVKAFQKDAGLPVTGSIDEATAQAMAEKTAVKFEVSEDFVNDLSEKKKVHFNAAKDAATEAGLSGAELAAFMAQVAHESDGFNTAKEYASGSAYEGRKDLGNTQPGDGKRYKGRGYIQLTGRSNYEKAGKALGLDLVGNPSLAEDPEVAADVSVWFWETQVRPQVPDFLDTERVTKVVNGGFNGLSDRKSYLEKFTKKWNEE